MYLVCASHRFNQCWNETKAEVPCDNCGSQNHGNSYDFIFKTMGDFVKHVLIAIPKFLKVVSVSHNESGFDMILAARNLIEDQTHGKIENIS